jgi:glutathione peroxidase
MYKKIVSILLLSLLITSVYSKGEKTVHDFRTKTIRGKEVKLKEYKGKVLLIVNTASKCGLTPQYAGLEELYRKYAEKGFVVLGFPCNQFLGQEPGTAEEIEKFCTSKYDVTFPLFEKLEVNGDNTHPLYLFLKNALPLEGKNDIRWNFEKFLIDVNGVPVKRYAPKTKPVEIEKDIEELLVK